MVSTHELDLAAVLESLYTRVCLQDFPVWSAEPSLIVCQPTMAGVTVDSVFRKEFVWNWSTRYLELVVNTEMSALYLNF